MNDNTRLASVLHADAPIGVFDSGLGGLRVLYQLVQAMPYKDFIYLADLRNMPYGGRSSHEIVELSHRNIQWLGEQGCKLVLAACHTSTTCLEASKCVISAPYFLNMARSLYDVVHDAVVQHALNSVVVLATERTVASGVYQTKLSQRLPNTLCSAVACPTWVPAIESGSDVEKRRAVLDIIPGIAYADAIVYGCTHFSEMDSLLSEYLPHTVRLDPALTLARLLAECVQPNQRIGCGTVRVFTNVEQASLLAHYTKTMFGVMVGYSII